MEYKLEKHSELRFEVEAVKDVKVELEVSLISINLGNQNNLPLVNNSS